MTLNQILAQLQLMADPEKVAYKEKKFAVAASNSLGIYQKDLKEFARKLPKDDDLAIELFETGIYEARLLCSRIFNPANLTETLVERWTPTFENWEICDSFCMGVYARSPLAAPIIHAWAAHEPAFEKRSAFATLSAYCMADKYAPNDTFEPFLLLIEREAWDNRIYVKKAVNWALRSIGKRNIDLRTRAISMAEEIAKQESKAAKWIARDALKELQSEKVRSSDYPRSVYRPR